MHQIKITKLFSRFDYNLVLKPDKLTIITGPNGYGKSTILKIINSLTKGIGGIYFFLKLDFEQIIVFFDSGKKLTIQKKYNELFLNKFKIDEKIFRDDIIQILDHRPYFYRLNEDTWINRRTNEKISLDDFFYKRYIDSFSRIYTNADEIKINKISNLLQDIKQELGDIFYINEQRLIKEVRNHDEIEYKSTIEELPEKLLHIINNSQQRYSDVANKLDSSYPYRLFENNEEISQEDFNNKLKSMTSKYEKLSEYDLASMISSKRIFFKKEYAKALKIYFDDFDSKYKVYEDLLNKLDLFTDIINSRLSFKQIKINKDKGLIVVDENPTKELQLNQLSSGEKQEIILFYDLIFSSDNKTFLMIDEPEISLHIVWQKKFMDDLIKIIKYKNINVIVATHSPQIINNHWEQQIDLGELYAEQFDSK